MTIQKYDWVFKNMTGFKMQSLMQMDESLYLLKYFC